MSAQKNKTVLAVTLAIVGVLLLSGVSFSFFPTPTQLTIQNQLTLPSVGTSQTPMFAVTGDFSNQTTGNTSVPIYAVGGLALGGTGATGSCGISYLLPPQNYIIIVIKEDGSVNSTAIQRQGNTYTLIRDITNQTLVIQKSDVIVNGGNHALTFNGIFNGNGGISIENLRGVTIENFNFSSQNSYVKMQNCTDILVQNNNFTNVSTGILLDSSSNCRIIQNNFVSTSVAVNSYYQDGNSQPQNNMVSKNAIYNAYSSGIWLQDTSSIVTDNVFINSWNSVHGGVNATIARNTFINGSCAIQVASYNQVYDNNLYNLSDEGMELSGFNSSIYRNTITNCSNAIMIYGPNSQIGGNTIWHNNFVNNTQLFTLYYTWTFPANNNWDNGKEGNYWSSYNGSDGNGDGVGDSPYVLAANCTDNYPLMQPYAAASSDVALGTLFFAAAAVTALVGVAVSIGVYAKFRGRS
jgi:parallel beta-helix repeat protein